jgi:hypothetical protein
MIFIGFCLEKGDLKELSPGNRHKFWLSLGLVQKDTGMGDLNIENARFYSGFFFMGFRVNFKFFRMLLIIAIGNRDF